MTQTQENPFIDPRSKNAWDKGYAAGSAACIQKDAEIARLKKALLNLVHLKAHKETYGKDEYYEKEQPLAWQQATEALKQ